MSFVVWYFLPFFVIDLFCLILVRMGRLYVFRAILFIYLSNFVCLPIFYLSQVGWKILTSRSRLYASAVIPDVRCTVRLGIAEIGLKVVFSLLLLSVFGYATFIEPHRIQVEEIPIVSAKVSEEVKILHISDIQSTGVGAYERNVFQLIQQIKPDLILHAGDFTQVRDPLKRDQTIWELAMLLGPLKPKYGIYFVLGDTDAPIKPQNNHWFEQLSGVKILVNQNVVIGDRAGQFRILGLALDTSRHGDRGLIQQWQNQNPPEAFTIIFGHALDYILNIQDMQVDLCLAGHTHGGQIRLPWFGPMTALSSIPKKWVLGYHVIHQLRLNVSAGVGSEHVRGLISIRFNCPPTMTLFKVT
jgi:predicted MPP superfamily phosphohydrolase